VTNFGIRQPAFWAHIVVDSRGVLYESCYVNATSTSGGREEKSWLQNTDGIDTYRSRDVVISNIVYQGGDDCIAFKPNSTGVVVSNATCVGGTGIAFGSIAQYKGTMDVIEDVVLRDIRLYASDQVRGYQGIYFKSWIGEEVGHPPNGGGGGYGYCRNVSISDVQMEGIDRPIALTAGLTYLDDEHGKHKYGTFEWSHINFTRVRATSTANRAVWLDCSPAQPCHHIRFEDVVITPGKDDHPEIHQVCNHVKHSKGDGLDACKPNDSDLESDTGGTM
jgi:polygalacturonase